MLWPYAIFNYFSCGVTKTILDPRKCLSGVWLSQSPDLWPDRIRKHSLTLERAPFFPPLPSYLVCDSGEFYATNTTHSFCFLRTDINDFALVTKHCPSQEDNGLLSLRVRPFFLTPTFGHIPQWQNLSPQGLVVQVSYTPSLFIPCV